MLGNFLQKVELCKFEYLRDCTSKACILTIYPTLATLFIKSQIVYLMLNLNWEKQ